MAKETKLDDSAEIYTKRTQQTEREKMSDMTFKEKREYFNTYYLRKTIVAILAVTLLGYLLYQTLSPKPEELLNVAVVNDYFESEKLKSFLSDLNTHFEVDPDNQKIMFDYSYYISDTDVSQNSVSSIQKLSTYISAEQIDVIIADEANFTTFMEQGYFIDLAELLPADLYIELADLLCEGTVYDEDLDGVRTPLEHGTYGLRLDSSSGYASSGSTMQKPVLGIVCNTKNADNTIEFIRYLLESK
ncbi:hypothetical protein [Anaerosporobacter sp.]|uniref:hypothetical protein n=1 Tax=Anaerosporobacter sp. TaxID=1872529 RepID=UPI00286F5FE5|nr:hypothetical protein [Anaerosporobacter sp.]